MATTFDSLAAETVLSICTRLDRQSLQAVCGVSKRFNALCTPKLYETLDVQLWHGLCRHKRRGEGFWYNVSCDSDVLDGSNDLDMLRKRLSNVRWISLNPVTEPDTRVLTAEEATYEIDTLLHIVGPLGDVAPRDTLRGFSWTLCRDVPVSIFQNLFEGQRNITSVSLLESTYEDYGPSNNLGTTPRHDTLINPPSFPTGLKQVNWRGLASIDQFFLAKSLLESNADSLRCLTLGTLAWNVAQDTWTEHRPLQGTRNFFATFVLGLKSGQTHSRFPLLTHLSLADISFHQYSLEMINGLNIPHLHKLTVRNCPRTSSLLKSLTLCGPFSNLRRLEISCIPESGRADERGEFERNLYYFLNALVCLEDVFLKVHSVRLRAAFFWSMISNRQSKTLKRFIWHETAVTFDTVFPFLVPVKLEWDEYGRELLFCPSLRCVALSGSPINLKKYLQRLRSRPETELLHIRDLKIQPSSSDVNEGSVSDAEPLASAAYPASSHMPEQPNQSSFERLSIGFRERLDGVDPTRLDSPNDMSEDYVDSDYDSDCAKIDFTSNPQLGANSEDHNDDVERGSNMCPQMVDETDEEGVDSGDFFMDNPEYMPSIPPKIITFAKWAFGPNGLPKLKVLALGDFSSEPMGREVRCYLRRAQSRKLCRNGAVSWYEYHDAIDDRRLLQSSSWKRIPFRRVDYFESRRGKGEALELINQNKDFLEACPHETLGKETYFVHSWREAMEQDEDE